MNENLKSLKSGDKLICIKNNMYEGELVIGDTYTFDKYMSPDGTVGLNSILYLKEFTERPTINGFFVHRFTKVEPKPTPMTTTQPRLPNGRFTSTSLPAQTRTTVAQFQTQPKSNVPKTLRNGSIYRVVGGPVARLVGTVKSFATLTVHGKPLAVKTDRVRLADKEDVTAYLADSAEAKV